MERQMMETQMDGGTDGWRDRWTDRPMDGRTDGRTDVTVASKSTGLLYRNCVAIGRKSTSKVESDSSVKELIDEMMNGSPARARVADQCC